MKGFAVTVAVAESDTDGNGMVYDFAALKVCPSYFRYFLSFFVRSFFDLNDSLMVYDFAALKVRPLFSSIMILC